MAALQRMDTFMYTTSGKHATLHTQSAACVRLCDRLVNFKNTFDRSIDQQQATIVCSNRSVWIFICAMCITIRGIAYGIRH